MSASGIVMAAPLFTAAIGLSFVGLCRGANWRDRVHFYWAALAISITAFCVESAYSEQLGPVLDVIVSTLATSCGFAWLFSRAVFRRESSRETWPLAFVVLLMVLGGVLKTLSMFGVEGGVVRMLAKLYSLTSSTVLLLPLAEAVEGFRVPLAQSEKRLRVAFLAGYVALFGLAVLWAGGSSPGDGGLIIKVVCSAAALGGATWMAAYRIAHPKPNEAAALKNEKPRSRAATSEELALAHKVERLFADEGVHCDPDLKVAKLARRLNEPSYKVSRSITALGFANFNRLANHYRIETAKSMLSDPLHDDRSVLAIAMEAGFGSIGPFNRAFKEKVGMTPGEFRGRRR